MRSIKFRAWTTDKQTRYRPNRMWSWEEISIECISDFWKFEKMLWSTDDAIVLMQFTGLKDRDGKEVYEGDLIDFAGLKPLRIEWRNAGFAAPLLPYEKSDPIALTKEGFAAFAEVIGNIYENPELVPKES